MKYLFLLSSALSQSMQDSNGNHQGPFYCPVGVRQGEKLSHILRSILVDALLLF